jgi:NAD(P)-dependent dehydrogenase (short-subunit alcohol dehydrogenase family)
MDTTKNILVVGAAKGIGRETCKQLESQDCLLIAADIDKANLDSSNAGSNRPFCLTCDITDEKSVSAALGKIEERVGKIDAVVMSAAVHCAYPAEFIPNKCVDRVLDVNLTSHIKFVRDILPLVNDGGKIIGISSNSAEIGIPMESVYAASKAGMERFYEALSIELTYRRIKCVIVQPGNVNTGFNETGNDYSPSGNTFVDDVYQKIVSAIDSQHGIPPQQVARTIVRAINAKSPRIRYLVGLNTLKTNWAKRLLGTELALKLLKKYFGIAK